MNDRPTVKMIRAYLDGELPDEDTLRMKQALETDARLRERVEFERRLKDRIGSVMTQDIAQTPADLEQRVRKALAASTPSESVAGRITPATKAVVTTRSSGANVFAIAACLAIVAGAVLFGIFGRPIDSDGRSAPTDIIAESALFVAGEHSRCSADDDQLQAKLVYSTPGQAFSALASHMGLVRIPSIDLSSLGFEFMGGGECGVPAADSSGHIMFQKPGSADPTSPSVSIFMMPDDGQFDQLYGGPPSTPAWYDLNVDPEGGRNVFVTTNGTMAYFLCAGEEVDLDAVASLVQTQIWAP